MRRSKELHADMGSRRHPCACSLIKLAVLQIAYRPVLVGGKTYICKQWQCCLWHSANAFGRHMLTHMQQAREH